eukprot:15582920-Heterocapsa_arctica.AAC.1
MPVVRARRDQLFQGVVHVTQVPLVPTVAELEHGVAHLPADQRSVGRVVALPICGEVPLQRDPDATLEDPLRLELLDPGREREGAAGVPRGRDLC